MRLSVIRRARRRAIRAWCRNKGKQSIVFAYTDGKVKRIRYGKRKMQSIGNGGFMLKVRGKQHLLVSIVGPETVRDMYFNVVQYKG